MESDLGDLPMEVNELHWDHSVRDTRMDLPEKQLLPSTGEVKGPGHTS